MSFNYRVVHRATDVVIGKGTFWDEFFGIYEVFYDKYGNPTAITQTPVEVLADDARGVREVLEAMLNACDEPILEYDDFKEQEGQ